MNKNLTNHMPIRPELLQLLTDEAGHSISIAVREGEEMILIYVNTAFKEMIGYSESECLFRDCWFLQKEGQNQQKIAEMKSVLESGKVVKTQLRSYRKNNEEFWSDLTITSHFDKQDEIMYYFFVQTELTDLIG